MTTIEQAGAIIVRSRDGEQQVLLVTSRKNPAHWLFPKGHVEVGETLAQAALREAAEEAGICGTLAAPAGVRTFEIGSHVFRVHYFLVTTDDEGRPEKGRQLAWYSYADALARLSFEDLRGLLRSAWHPSAAPDSRANRPSH